MQHLIHFVVNFRHHFQSSYDLQCFWEEFTNNASEYGFVSSEDHISMTNHNAALRKQLEAAQEQLDEARRIGDLRNKRIGSLIRAFASTEIIADTVIDTDLESFLKTNQKIRGIKHLRTKHGIGLREAKEMYESIASSYAIIQLRKKLSSED